MQALIGIIIAVIVIGGGWFILTQQGTQENGGAAGTMLEGSEMPDNGLVGGDAAPGGDAMMEGPEGDTHDGAMMDDGNADVKEFTVEGSNFYFTPNTMTVKKGDTVRVTFKNVEGFHDFVIDEFDVATERSNGGEDTTVEFVASEAGTFEYYCSVGTHREQGMFGTLTVTE